MLVLPNITVPAYYVADFTAWYLPVPVSHQWPQILCKVGAAFLREPLGKGVGEGTAARHRALGFGRRWNYTRPSHWAEGHTQMPARDELSASPSEQATPRSEPTSSTAPELLPLPSQAPEQESTGHRLASTWRQCLRVRP